MGATISSPLDMVACPNCSSEKTRRGGNAIWLTYVVLIAGALVAVLVYERDAALVGGIMIAVIVLAHLAIGGRVCLDCGNQFRG